MFGCAECRNFIYSAYSRNWVLQLRNPDKDCCNATFLHIFSEKINSPNAGKKQVNLGGTKNQIGD